MDLIIAKYDGTCAGCRRAIAAGHDSIAEGNPGEYFHQMCHPEAPACVCGHSHARHVLDDGVMLCIHCDCDAFEAAPIVPDPVPTAA